MSYRKWENEKIRLSRESPNILYSIGHQYYYYYYYYYQVFMCETRELYCLLQAIITRYYCAKQENYCPLQANYQVSWAKQENAHVVLQLKHIQQYIDKHKFYSILNAQFFCSFQDLPSRKGAGGEKKKSVEKSDISGCVSVCLQLPRVSFDHNAQQREEERSGGKKVYIIIQQQ